MTSTPNFPVHPHNKAANTGLGVNTALFLLLGGLALWASYSNYLFVWAQAKLCFPDAGIRILMVNTDATLKSRDRYTLPPDIKNSIALRALILNKDDKVIATASREGHLFEFPDPPAGKETIFMDIVFARVVGWFESSRVAAWIMIVFGFFQSLCLIIKFLTAQRKNTG